MELGDSDWVELAPDISWIPTDSTDSALSFGTDISDFMSPGGVFYFPQNGVGTSVATNREREAMIPHRAVLTIPRTEAETQRALFADLPDLTPREQAMMDIYDTVIAGDKIIKLQEVLNGGGVYKASELPKVILAPVSAESATFVRTVERKKVRSDRREMFVSSAFTAGKWSFGLLDKEGRDTFTTRITEAEAMALTPLIPPPHRDQVQDGDLLLWEPVWLYSKEVVINADPAILRPLSHGLYKVIAAWDLTPVETMMLSG